MKPAFAVGVVVNAILVVGPLPPLMVAAGCGNDDGPSANDDASPNDDAAPNDGEPNCTISSGWSAAPSVLGGAIQETAVVEFDGKIYVLGGIKSSLEVVKAVRIFDTATCTWSDGPDLPREIHHANATIVGETIYILGAMETLQFGSIGDVFAWNPKTDAGWTSKTSMPAGTQRGASVGGAIGDVIYVAGGLRNGSVANFTSYSTTTDTWDTNLPALPQAGDHGCGGVVGGKLYVVGGRGGKIGAISALVFEYTPGGSWVPKTSMPTARGGMACGILDDRIIVAGGEGNPVTPSGVFSEVEAYTVSSDTWDTLQPMATPRHGMGAAVSGGVFYAPGGATNEGFGAVDTHETFRP